MDQVHGIVTSLRYKNDENGFCIASLLEDNNDAPCTLKGYMDIVVGEHLSLVGEWINDPTYGIQFQVKRYSRFEPTTEDAIERLLGSGLIKGVGPKRAEWMVDKHGTKIIDIIKTNDPRLYEVPGIGPKTARSIVEQWHFFYGKEKIATKLVEAGFSRTMSSKILRADFDDDMATAIEDNPYILMKIPFLRYFTLDPEIYFVIQKYKY